MENRHVQNCLPWANCNNNHQNKYISVYRIWQEKGTALPFPFVAAYLSEQPCYLNPMSTAIKFFLKASVIVTCSEQIQIGLCICAS